MTNLSNKRFCKLVALMLTVVTFCLHSRPVCADEPFLIWGAYYEQAIKRINSDGTNLATILARSADVASAVVNAAGTTMYWTESDGTLYKANTDGTSVVQLLNGLGSIYYMQLDEAAEHIYFADYVYNRIQRVNFDGTSQITIASGLSGPYAIALDVAHN